MRGLGPLPGYWTSGFMGLSRRSAVPGPSGRDRTTGTMTTDSTTKSDHDSEFVRATTLSRFDPRQIMLTEVFA